MATSSSASPVLTTRTEEAITAAVVFNTLPSAALWVFSSTTVSTVSQTVPFKEYCNSSASACAVFKLISVRSSSHGRLNPTYPPAPNVTCKLSTEYTPSSFTTSLSSIVPLFQNTPHSTSGFSTAIIKFHALSGTVSSKGLILCSPTLTMFFLIVPSLSRLSTVNFWVSFNLLLNNSSFSSMVS